MEEYENFCHATSFAIGHGMEQHENKSVYQNFIVWLQNKHEFLDGIEKRYLKALIRPFRKDVVCITKRAYMNNLEYLNIDIVSEFDKQETIVLPLFHRMAMYKGMKPDIEYTLEELGL